jgi:2-hydroxy-3-oxopropionate reductase
MSKPEIGFIGLGLMGSAMVERLQAQGYKLTVIANRSRNAIDAAVKRGAREAKTARELAAGSDIVMLCVDTSAAVESRMRGPDGVIAGLRKDSVVIDFGTSLPASTRQLGAEVAAAGGHYMDAPLGRTPTHAREGKLNIMAAGDRKVFDRVKPVLDDIGENVFHLGELGAGNTIKLINNFLAMTTANAVAEAFAMADASGIARDKLYSVISAGPLRSAMMDFVKAYAVDGKRDALAFSVRNGRKDVGYYATMADEAGIPSLISPAVKQALTLAVAEGYGDRMVPELVDFHSALLRGKRDG